jgi:hypothetical protein
MDDGTLLKVSCPAETWRPRTADQVGKDTKLLDLRSKFMLKFGVILEKLNFLNFFA